MIWQSELEVCETNAITSPAMQLLSHILQAMQHLKFLLKRCMMVIYIIAGRGSAVRFMPAWYVDSRGFDPQVWWHSFMEIGHK